MINELLGDKKMIKKKKSRNPRGCSFIFIIKLI